MTPWQYELSSAANHERAALLLAEKLSWRGQWVCGWESGSAIFVCVSEEVAS